MFGIFSNLMQANRWVHASPGFLGFDVANPPRAGRIECFRAIEESAAYVSRGHLAIVEEVAGLEVDEVGAHRRRGQGHAVAADHRRHARRCRCASRVVKESTALGAAIYAGVGAGLFDDADRGRQASWLSFERTVRAAARRPSPPTTSSTTRWSELYRRSLELSEAGLVRPLWRAAGT